MMTNVIEWLDERRSGEAVGAATVGGKGAGLAFLAGCTTESDATVPGAFAVTTAAFTQAVGTDLTARIEALRDNAGSAPTALDQVAALARDLVAAVDLPEPLQAAIRDAYGQLSDDGTDVPVAVRSSAAGEDSADASFAGEHDSFLWVTGAEQVITRVRDCWASLWTARAMGYRADNDQPVTPMGVVVQHMVPAAAAGVFMTLNPLNGDRSKVVIEALWGLGEPLVSGTADPDRWVIDKITGDVASSAIAHKPTLLGRDTDLFQGVKVQDVPADRQDKPSLTRDQIADLVAVARVIERRAGCPQDGEFAVSGGRIHLLQARPETVWANRPRQSITGGKNALGSIVSTLSRGSGWKTD